MIIAIAALFLITAIHAFSASGNNNLAIYWGQNSAGSQLSLASYCSDSTVDIILLSFLDEFFGTGNLPVVNFANACGGSTFSGSELLQCDQIAADIKTCQANGKKILLSLGGASGAYGFTSSSQATGFADLLWNLFGGGSSFTRPFGTSIVDGFDLDIEGGSSSYYSDFITQMRTHYASQSAKTYYTSAAPQCPYPDSYVGAALSASYFDFIFVQFYNNYCGINTWKAGTTTDFNFKTWDTFAKSSPNPNVKVYLGVPAASGAANSGYYVSPATLSAATKELQSTYSSFGGVMMWDMSQAYSNTPSGYSSNYAVLAKSALTASSSSTTQASSAQPTTKTTTTTTVQSTTFTVVTIYPTPTSSTSTTLKQSSSSTTIIQKPSSTSSVKTSTSTSSTKASTSTSTSKLSTSTSSTKSSTSSSSTKSSTTSTMQSSTLKTSTASIKSSSTGVIKNVVPVTTTIITSTTTKTSVSTIIGSPEYTSLQLTKTSTTATSTSSSLSSTNTCPVAGGSCTDGTYQCNGTGGFAQCANGKWVMMACAAGTWCTGTTSVYCDYASNVVNKGCGSIV